MPARVRPPTHRRSNMDRILFLLLLTASVNMPLSGMTYAADERVPIEVADARQRPDVWQPRVLRSFTTGENRLSCCGFDPSGERLVTAGWNDGDGDVEAWKMGDAPGDIHIWDVSTGVERAHLSGDFGAVFDVAFSRDGRQIVTAGRVLNSADRGAVRIWSAETLQPVKTLLGHTNWVLGVAVSPDGRLIASGSFDRTVRIWDASTGNKVIVLEHPSIPDRLSFSRDGTNLRGGVSRRRSTALGRPKLD